MIEIFDNTIAIAHSKNHSGVRQTLQEHLANVAKLSAGYATPFGQADAAESIGWLHDVGKLKADWQERIMDLEAWDEGGKQTHAKPVFVEMKHDHKMAGAAYVVQSGSGHLESRKLTGLLIAGHHGGIADYDKFIEEIESGKWNATRDETAERVGTLQIPKLGFNHLVNIDYFSLSMLYSCLVDADCVDTSSHHDGRIVPPPFAGMAKLYQKLLTAQMPATASPAVQKMRSDVRDACLYSIPQARGVFSLHAPTGSGKTVSGGLWATGHAAHHNLRRLVYVAPYRTIIDQTADVYASLFGDENVLPHHATADFWDVKGAEGRLQRQLAENWELPVIVTTSEQFFESIYSGRPGASRKLHNLANSVLVIDEPQALPLRLLTPCLAALRALVEQFGCSVLFMSATVPPLQHAKLFGLEPVGGLNTPKLHIEEILSQYAKLGSSSVTTVLPKTFEPVKRVTVDIEKFNGCYWSSLGEFMGTKSQALAIANIRGGALNIFKSLPIGNRTYLSTWLCPLHRKNIVSEIRERLQTGKVCHVASTQVIEAGVDLDFPDTLLREKAPLDSLLQAFGRCNRNGHGKGECFVFSPHEGNGLRDYDKAISVVNALLYEQKRDPFDPTTLADYYTMLYAISNLDREKIMEHVSALNFETIRDGNEFGEGGFRLIQEAQVHLIVEYGTQEQIDGRDAALDAVQGKVVHDDFPPAWATRRLQNFVVSVYPQVFDKLTVAFPFAVANLYLNYFVWSGDYDERTGLGDVIESLGGSAE